MMPRYSNSPQGDQERLQAEPDDEQPGQSPIAAESDNTSTMATAAASQSRNSHGGTAGHADHRLDRQVDAARTITNAAARLNTPNKPRRRGSRVVGRQERRRAHDLRQIEHAARAHASNVTATMIASSSAVMP
jgi:hypothetical protein